MASQQLTQPAFVTPFFFYFPRGDKPSSEGTVTYPCEADDSLLATHTHLGTGSNPGSTVFRCRLFRGSTRPPDAICYQASTALAGGGQRLQEGFLPASSHEGVVRTLVLCFLSNSNAAARWHWLEMGHTAPPPPPPVVKFTCDLLVG